MRRKRCGATVDVSAFRISVFGRRGPLSVNVFTSRFAGHNNYRSRTFSEISSVGRARARAKNIRRFARNRRANRICRCSPTLRRHADSRTTYPRRTDNLTKPGPGKARRSRATKIRHGRFFVVTARNIGDRYSLGRLRRCYFYDRPIKRYERKALTSVYCRGVQIETFTGQRDRRK